MKRLSTLISFIFTRAFYHKAIAYWILILFLVFFQDFALIFFLTFIFAFLFYSSAKFIKEKVDNFVCSKIDNIKKKKNFKKYFSLNFVIILQYIIFSIVLIWIISNAIPKLQTELTGLSKTIPMLWEQIDNIKWVLWDINNNYSEIDSTFKDAFSSDNINYEVIFSIFEKLKSAWSIILKFIFSLILSFIFLLDRKKLKKYLGWIKKSNFSFLHDEYKIIFDKIIRSFGLILKAQSLIALANATLTIIGLFIIWFVFKESFINPMWFPYFPYLFTLGLIVFIFGFVPVVWVFLSSIPIMIVGYSATWTFTIVIAIILLITIIHIIEAYILNPRIVSNFLELPVSLTFVILFMWEHLFWVAWLLVWVSLFYFITELIRDIDKAITRKTKIKKLEKKVVKRVKKSA